MAEEIFTVFSDLSQAFDNKYKDDPNFIQRMECWTKEIDKYIRQGDIVYDLGCGSGVFSFYAATQGGQVTGIDGSEGMVNLCNEKLNRAGGQALNLRFIRETLPLKNAVKYPKANLILCSSMFEYIREKEEMIQCYNTLLQDGGTLLISVPNRKSAYRIFEKTVFGITGRPSYFKHVHNRYSESELVVEFRKYGFLPKEKIYYADNYLFSGLLKKVLPESNTSNLLLVAFQKVNG
jgi:2-polyprenyl-6-hydroxyphenyl methylase/3-demethylubiquinone-9 3-methyltransferase